MEVALTSASVGAFAAGLAASGVGVPMVAAAFIGFTAGAVLQDLGNDDSRLANTLGLVIEDAEDMISAYGLDRATEAIVRQFAQAIAEGLPPPVLLPG